MNGEGARTPEEREQTADQKRNVVPAPDVGGGAEDMGALLEQYEDTQHAQIRRGDLVEGTVVMVDREEILVDIGGKMEAIIASGEIADTHVSRGDQISAVIVASENSEGRPVISIQRARAEIGWRDLQIAFEAGRVIEGEVVDHNKGGLIVAVEGVRGFVPLSQIVELRRGGSEEQVEEKLQSMHGQNLFLKVIEMNRRRNRLILSERQAAQERRGALKDQLLAELQPGEVRTGRVSSLTDFGAFVDLGGADGLVHLSELSWGQVQHPSQILKVGQELKVRVVGVDRENKKIALSLKQVEENPWSRIQEKYQIGDVVAARITKLAQFGAFAELEAGVEGLVHISELSEERITHPKQVVREGETVQLKVIKIDSERHRVGLSLRQAEEEGEYAGIEDWSGGGSYSYASGTAAEATPSTQEPGASVGSQFATESPAGEEESSQSAPELVDAETPEAAVAQEDAPIADGNLDGQPQPEEADGAATEEAMPAPETSEAEQSEPAISEHGSQAEASDVPATSAQGQEPNADDETPSAAQGAPRP